MAENEKTELQRASVETAPPDRDGNGVELYEGFPLNHRLRAEALVAAGKTTDKSGLITDGMIAGTKARLDAGQAARDAETVPQLIERINAMADADELTAAREKEAAGKNRLTAIAAMDARLAALNDSASSNAPDDNTGAEG